MRNTISGIFFFINPIMMSETVAHKLKHSTLHVIMADYVIKKVICM